MKGETGNPPRCNLRRERLRRLPDVPRLEGRSQCEPTHFYESEIDCYRETEPGLLASRVNGLTPLKGGVFLLRKVLFEALTMLDRRSQPL
jgi:hypothetical protein